MEFSHQSNLERGVRYFNFESNFLVGDQEDVSEAPEDAAPVIARSLQVACVHIESFQKVLIQHIGEAETMGHSFDDGRRFVREVWSARRGIDVVMDISRLGIGDGLDLGDNDAVLQLQLVHRDQAVKVRNRYRAGRTTTQDITTLAILSCELELLSFLV